MIVYILAFTLGICGLQFFKVLPSLWWLICIPVISFIIVSLLRKACPWPDRRREFGVLIFFLLGFGWALLYAHWTMSWTLPKKLEDKAITVTGTVASLPQIKEHMEKFIFKPLTINGHATLKLFFVLSAKTGIQLSWYNDYPQISVGDKWQLLVKLKRPYGFMNPGSFDYEKYLFQQGIRAVGYVQSSKTNCLLTSHWYNYPIGRFRQYLQEKIDTALDGKPFSGIITALTVGSRSGISQSQWSVLKNTGTSHLVAISGLHIGLIFGFIFLFLSFIWENIPYLTLRIPAQQAGAVGALFGAFLYSAMAGFAISTQRALIMALIFTLALLLRRNNKLLNVLFIALFAVLLRDPLAVLSAGFWLSFTAVFIFIYSFVKKPKAKSIWQRWLAAQWVAFLGLLPLSLVFFQQCSLVSCLANFIAIPWVGFIVVPLSLIGGLLSIVSGHLGKLMLLFAEQAMALIWIFLQWLANQQWAVWRHGVYDFWILILAFAGILLLLSNKKLSKRWFGVLLFLPLIFYKPPGPKPGEVWFTLLDVGQGLASVVRTKSHVLIYDTGPKFNETFDTGEAVVAPFLRVFGISKVSALVVSHGDNDHIGGAQSILAMLNVRQVITSVPQRFPKINAKYCEAGQSWSWDGVKFEFLSPPNKNKFSGNDASCVLHITDGKNSILLTGDIEALTEHYLFRRQKPNLHSTILVAPHHGSNTSSTEGFVKAVQAKYILFPVGYLNRFHFPTAQVIKRYKQTRAVLFDTAHSGAITFKFNSTNKINPPAEYRKLASRYWNSK